MKNSKRFFSAVLALICVLSVFTAIPVTADAAYSCTQVSGNSSKSRTFYINTGDRFLFADKLTLTQTQGTMDFTGWNGFGSKTVKGYEGYVISVVKTSGGLGDPTSARWYGGTVSHIRSRSKKMLCI